MPRLQPANATEDGPGARDVARREVFVERVRIEPLVDEAGFDQCLELG